MLKVICHYKRYKFGLNIFSRYVTEILEETDEDTQTPLSIRDLPIINVFLRVIFFHNPPRMLTFSYLWTDN
jgi:hypothetical protein